MQGRDEGGTVRSVERALAIVELLGEHQELGLEELHYLTGLPKATVSRLLHTLLEQGWLYRGLCDRRYRLCSRRLYGDPHQRFSRLLVEQAAPLMRELSERTGLVTDLSFFDGERLHVMESAIPEVLRKRYPFNRLVVGQQASLFHSAMGKACLGELDSAEVQRLARHHHLCGDDLLRIHEQTHSQGFGERTEGTWEYAVRLPFLIRAVALPVRSQGRLVGSIALHWPRDEHSVASVQQRHLASLADAVELLQHHLG
ncbi:IclR family transcriptional regulator [Pseudomonas sp. Q1-7]|uniref:IclR family transcriptional regulator n=1 Tax=Pseudomonas sp. Q1-7 TaxID=3020843 RepID=UPI0022FFD82F|nr:helix-turn-helix domain-containing protein [Pseudomonas sp. Q1-7]